MLQVKLHRAACAWVSNVDFEEPKQIKMQQKSTSKCNNLWVRLN